LSDFLKAITTSFRVKEEVIIFISPLFYTDTPMKLQDQFLQFKTTNCSYTIHLPAL